MSVEFPYDRWAEESVVGCVVASRRGAELAAARLRADDFFNPVHAQIFRAALAVDADDQDERVAEVVRVTDTATATVLRLVDERPCHADRSGSLARRVKDAAQRRALMSLCSRIYSQLGSGARLSDVAAEARQIEAALGS